MKITTYFILVVAAICVMVSAVFMVITALQVVAYIAAAVLIIWVLSQIAIFMNKTLTKKPPQ